MRSTSRDPLRTRLVLRTRHAALGLGLGLLSLGLASRVWGGPPEPEPEPEPAPEAAVDPVGAPASEPAAAVESEPLPESDDIGLPDAISLRTRMEEGMAEIGQLAVEARNDADLVRATCVLDKQDRAADVMELGTGELLVIRDPNTAPQARDFALEKLDAAALRIDLLVEEAKACAGQQGPEDEVDMVRNTAEEPRTIPLWDPTAGLGDNPVPPPMDGNWPPAASPIE